MNNPIKLTRLYSNQLKHSSPYSGRLISDASCGPPHLNLNTLWAGKHSTDLLPNFGKKAATHTG